MYARRKPPWHSPVRFHPLPCVSTAGLCCFCSAFAGLNVEEKGKGCGLYRVVSTQTKAVLALQVFCFILGFTAANG